MPDMSGLDLQRELLRRGLRIRTVVIAGHDSDSYRKQCRDLGAAAFLVKPVGRDASLPRSHERDEARKHQSVVGTTRAFCREPVGGYEAGRTSL
jgi:FixJ family two-component response regulator